MFGYGTTPKVVAAPPHDTTMVRDVDHSKYQPSEGHNRALQNQLS